MPVKTLVSLIYNKSFDVIQYLYTLSLQFGLYQKLFPLEQLEKKTTDWDILFYKCWAFEIVNVNEITFR